MDTKPCIWCKKPVAETELNFRFNDRWCEDTDCFDLWTARDKAIGDQEEKANRNLEAKFLWEMRALVRKEMPELKGKDFRNAVREEVGNCFDSLLTPAQMGWVDHRGMP